MSTRKTSILYQTPRFYAWDAKQAIAVNEDIFSSISDYLSKERTEKTAQPYLVIGEAGSGKTYLLKRLLNAIEKDNRLALFPVLMDAKALFSSEDIWMRCAKRLNLATSSGNVFDDLVSWQVHHACRIVLFVDNIQYYFQRTDDAGHYNLRGKLNKAGAPVLIATANEVSSFFTDYKSAFFDGFKVLIPCWDKTLSGGVSPAFGNMCQGLSVPCSSCPVSWHHPRMLTWIWRNWSTVFTSIIKPNMMRRSFRFSACCRYWRWRTRGWH